ncbi:MAG: hypothetical protein U0838_05095 [Chloroflexota bacterium]
MTRFVDRGAITAAWVGLGMAVTVVISFVLVIPIEFLVAPSALLGGMLIGYYANARSARFGEAVEPGAAERAPRGRGHGLTYAVLLLGVKAIFFNFDGGYPDFNRKDEKTGQLIEPLCDTGAPCVYARYLKLGRGPAFEAAGITNVDQFTSFYWSEQISTSAMMLTLSVVGALAGGGMYGMANRRKPEPESGAAPA